MYDEKSLEMWGGLECTVNRVHNIFYDQLEMSGHYQRDADIDLIASLGISKLRFPILWEKHEPNRTNTIDWSWTDKRLKQLQDHSITPIVGLVHHGSGPVYTNLGSSSFATGLASYASKVASRYPWLDYYTPVNEPLTTARFSGLYGYWYPHKQSETAFCTMLLNQLKATVLAMQEIRKINPDAKLIQTEDLGKTYAVPPLQYQADFENDRRWISFDLLCGKVDKEHPLWDYFMRARISEDSLLFFKENPCPPDILGLNYYVTSERFLDTRLENYPEHLHGGNWLERYVDTEAVRVNHHQEAGLRLLLDEVNDRYRLPIAITEAHLHCTAEESARWFKEVWEICCEKKTSGLPVHAVTAWSLLGAFGWNRLLTSANHEYESGAFDLRGSSPRPTLTAKLIQSLTAAKEFSHPVLDSKGWWHRHDRFSGHDIAEGEHEYETGDSKKILIVGDDGPMKSSFEIFCRARSLSFDAVSDRTFDIAMHEYWAVIHLAEETDLSLAQMCKNEDIQFMSFSIDQAHDILKTNPSSIIIKVGMMFDVNIEDESISSIHESSASYLPDVTNVALDLLISEEYGIWNLVHGECEMMPSFENAMDRFRAFAPGLLC